MEIRKHNHTTPNPLNWDRFMTTVLLEVKRGDRIYTSTGVLLDNRSLITAAHSIDCADEVKVILTHDYNYITESYQVERCYIHPEYNPSTSLFENDLAVLILKQEIAKELLFDEIPSETTLDENSVLERIGFGNRANKNRRAWTNPRYITTSFSKRTFILNDRYSFIGDSGGPIYQNINGERKLVGLHSTKEVGEKTYVVNLSDFKNWIDSIVEAA